MTSKLTKAEQAYLIAMPDWSARYEIMARLNRPRSFRSSRAVQKMLDRLYHADLIDYGSANDTWRVSEAGRAALEGEGR